jgi:hypothetical protein
MSKYGVFAWYAWATTETLMLRRFLSSLQRSAVVRYQCALRLERPESTHLAATRHARRPARYVDATGPRARCCHLSISVLFPFLIDR